MMNMVMPMPGNLPEPALKGSAPGQYGTEKGPVANENIFAGLLAEHVKPNQKNALDINALAALIPPAWQAAQAVDVADKPAASALVQQEPSGIIPAAGRSLMPPGELRQLEKALLSATTAATPEQEPVVAGTISRKLQNPTSLTFKPVARPIQADGAATPGPVPTASITDAELKGNLLLKPLKVDSAHDQSGRDGSKKVLAEQRFERLLQPASVPEDNNRPPAESSAKAAPLSLRAPEHSQPLRPTSLKEAAELQPDRQTNTAIPQVQPDSAQLVSASVQKTAPVPPQLQSPTRAHGAIHDQVVVQQITSHFDAQGSFESGQAHLKLYPEELGEVHLHLDVHKGNLAARLQAETPEVRDILHRNLDHLRHSLEQQGLKVGRLEVTVLQDSARSDGQPFQSGSGHHGGFDWTQNGSLFQQQRGQHQQSGDPITSHEPHPPREPLAPEPDEMQPRIMAAPGTGVSLRV